MEGSRQAGLAGRFPVDVLDVERPEVGELDERGDRGQPRVSRPEFEALDLCRLGAQRGASEILGDRERRPPRLGVDRDVPGLLRREGEDDGCHPRERRQPGPRPGQVDDRLLLV